jgi:Asp-tRNA(Asn)/Glu-tRNA(Gln) amidotransferase A subunit family amidase
MTRTIADLQAFDDVLAGWDAGDPVSIRQPADGGRQTAHGGRVGFFEDDGVHPVTPDTRRAIHAAAEALAGAGFIVDEFRPPALAQAGALWDVFFAEVGMLVLGDAMAGAERELPILKAHLRRHPDRAPLSARALTDAWMTRDLTRVALAEQMGARRILLCPVAAVPAFRHGEREWPIDGRTVGYLEAMRYTQWFNILGNPAVTVPVTCSAEGLPIGVQVVGRPFEDRYVMEVAAAIEEACGGYQPPPDRSVIT